MPPPSLPPPSMIRSYPLGYRLETEAGTGHWSLWDVPGPPRSEESCAMKMPEEVVEDVRRRLHRAAGQVQAIERMLDEGRECRDVVTQISAATKALEQAGFKLVGARVAHCSTPPVTAVAG